MSAINQLGRQEAAVADGISLLPEKSFSLPDEEDRPQEVTMAPAFGEPDMSCSHFVAMWFWGTRRPAIGWIWDAQQ